MKREKKQDANRDASDSLLARPVTGGYTMPRDFSSVPWLHLVPPTLGSTSLRERLAHHLFAFNSQLDQKANQIKVTFLIAF